MADDKEMNDRALRLKCLQMAQDVCGSHLEEIPGLAKSYYAWITGTEAKVVSDSELFDKIIAKESEMAAPLGILRNAPSLGAGVSGNEKLSGSETELVEKPIPNSAWVPPGLSLNQSPAPDYAPDPAAVDDPWAKQQLSPEDKETSEWWKRQIGGGK